MANRRRKELTDIAAAKRSGEKALEDAKAGRIQRDDPVDYSVRGYAEIPRLEDYTGGNSPVNRPSVAVDNSIIPVLGATRTVEPIGGNRDYSYEAERLARETEQAKYDNLTEQDKARLDKIDEDMRRLASKEANNRASGGMNARRISGLSSERNRLLGQNLSQDRSDQADTMAKWLDTDYKMTDSEIEQAKQIIKDYEDTEYKNANLYQLTEAEQNRQSQINALRDKVSKERAGEYGVMNATINPILTAADNDFYGWTVDDLQDELSRQGDVTSKLDPEVKAYVGQLQNEIQDLTNKLNSRSTVYSTGDAGVDEVTGATTSYKNASELKQDIEDKQKQMYKLMLEAVRGDNGPDYDSYALRKANAQKQNPVAYTGADMATRMLESAAIQNAVGSNGFAADMLVDALTDTAPEYAANRAAGMSRKEAGNQAFGNALLNTAMDTGAWAMSNMDGLIPSVKRANVDEAIEDAARQADIPKVDPAELAAKNEIDAAAKTDAVNEAVEEIENLSKQVSEAPESVDYMTELRQAFSEADPEAKAQMLVDGGYYDDMIAAGKAYQNGELDGAVEDFLAKMERNGDPTPAKRIVDNNTYDHQALKDQYGGDWEAMRRGTIKEYTGVDDAKADEYYAALRRFVGGGFPGKNDTEILDDYISKAPTYQGQIIRGMHFNPEDGSYDEFMKQVHDSGTVTLGKPSSWATNPESARVYSHMGDDGVDSVEIVCNKNRTSSPIDFINGQGEDEVISSSNASWTVLNEETYTRPNGSRKTIIRVAETGDKTPPKDAVVMPDQNVEAPGKGAFSNGGGVPPEEPPIDLTRNSDGEMLERGMSKHVRGEDTPMKVEGVSEEVQAAFADDKDMYAKLANKDTQALANDIYNSGDATISIDGKVYSGNPETKFRKLLEEKNPAALPLGHQLAKDYSAAGNHDMAAQIYRDMGKELTKAGQFTQASVLAMMKNDPLTALQYAQREIDALNQSGAKKFGKKWTDLALTPEEIQAFNSITPGDTEAIKALYDQIGARLGKEYPTTFMEKLLEGRKVAMLFNVRTNVRNAGANVPTLGMRWVADRLAAVGEGAVHLINPNFQRTQAITGSGIKGRKLANEIFNSPKVQALVNGTSGKYEIPELKSSMMKDRQMFKGTPISKWINKMTNGGIEKVNKKLFGKEGVESGLETIRNATYKMLDLGDSPFVKENFVERLGSYIHANKITDIADVPDEAIQMAWEEAMKATYKDNSWAVKMLQGFKTGMEKVPGIGKPLSQAVIPFVQAPGNIAARMVDYSPIKATKGVADIIAGALKKDDAAVRKGIDEAAKGLTGSGLIVLGMKLREAGLITGDYSDDKDQKNFEKQNGFIPWALHIGDKYFQYDWAQPFAEPIIVGTLLQDAISKSDQYDNEILRDLGIENEGLETALGVTWEGGKAALNSWFNASPLQGFAELMSGGYNGTDIAQNIVDAGIGDFAGALIPSLANATAKTIDTTQRQTYDPSSKLRTFVNQQKAKIPGLSDNLPTKYDNFGEEMKYADSKGEAFAQRFLIPGNYGTDSNDPVDVTINNLFNDTKDARVFPTTAPNSIGDRKLTAQESSDYQHDMGARSKEIAAAFIKSDLYKSMTNEERVNALNDIYGASKAITERDLFGKAIAQGNNYEKAVAAFDEGKTDGVIDYLSNKYNKYGIDAKAYKEMVAAGEDLTPYEGYKEARASYGIDDSKAYREAYASGKTPEEKLANLDNEVQYQSTCKEYGLDPDGKATRSAWDSALHASADPVAAIQKAAENKETALNTGFVTSDGKVNQPAYDKAVSVLGDDPTVLSNYVSFKNKAEAQNATSLDQYIPMLEAIPGMTKEEKGKYAALYKAPNAGSSAEKVLYSPYGYEGYYNYRLIQNAPDLNDNGKPGDKGDRIKYMYDVLKWDDTDDIYKYFSELDY